MGAYSKLGVYISLFSIKKTKKTKHRSNLIPSVYNVLEGRGGGDIRGWVLIFLFCRDHGWCLHELVRGGRLFE